MRASNVKWFVRNQLRVEAADEGITRTVCVHNVCGINQKHGEHVSLSLMHDDRWLGALCDDNGALTLAIDLKGVMIANCILNSVQ